MVLLGVATWPPNHRRNEMIAICARCEQSAEMAMASNGDGEHTSVFCHKCFDSRLMARPVILMPVGFTK